MEILWLIVGFLIGLLVAWFYLDARYKKQSAEREAELLHGRREAEEAVERERDAHNTTKQRVSELQTSQETPARMEAAGGENRAEIADTPAAGMAGGSTPANATTALASSAPATDTGGGTTPAHAESSPAGNRPASGAADDLTKIKGIGQVLQGKLNQLGITTFKQIAEFTPADMERVNAVLDFPGRIERERWVEQARGFVRQ